jgi:hypothetical protein
MAKEGKITKQLADKAGNKFIHVDNHQNHFHVVVDTMAGLAYKRRKRKRKRS